MFHFNPHLLHQLECSWNFKNNFCTDAGNVCQHAEENGAGAVHGITSAFFGDVNPTFRGLYEGKVRLNFKIFQNFHFYVQMVIKKLITRVNYWILTKSLYIILAIFLEN